MSSWGQPAPNQTKLRYSDLFFKISTSGYGTNFQQFFMCWLYARHVKKPLYLCDTTSNLSSTFHLILDTFQPIKGIIYTGKSGLPVFQDKVIEMKEYLTGLTDEFLRSEARSVFRWNGKTQGIIDAAISHLPQFDIGIHIRMGDKITSGEMAAIPLSTYADAIKQTRALLAKESINIYVMTDTPSVLESLKGLLDANTCALYSLPSPIVLEGHDQRTFNRMEASQKMAAYYHFLSEFHIMRRCAQIICTYSSNIGRMLYLTREPGTEIRSLDVPLSRFYTI
jgi:hypothetical protein